MTMQGKSEKDTMGEEDWKSKLSPEEYRVLRQCGTEPAFQNEFWNHFEKGIYRCGACGQKLFTSDTKFKSGSGWPSFFDAIDKSKITERVDTSHGMVRTEVICSNCKSHLGHVFEDGPKPTGKRYCVNSIALEFAKPKE